MSNYPANVTATDSHFNPIAITQNDIDVSIEETLMKIKEEGLDGTAEAIMHFEGRETFLLQQLKMKFLNACIDKGIDPAELFLSDARWHNVAAFIAALEMQTEFKYWSSVEYADDQQYTDMLKICESL